MSHWINIVGCVMSSPASTFSLPAGVATEAHQRYTLERLCRHITRSAVSDKRLPLAIQERPGRAKTIPKTTAKYLIVLGVFQGVFLGMGNVSL